MPAIILNPTAATPEQNFQTLQRGLEFGQFTPRTTNMGTFTVARGTYQLCGRYCHIMAYFEVNVDILWAVATSYMEFPISPSLVNITDGLFTWGQVVIPGARAPNAPVTVTRGFRTGGAPPFVIPAPGFNIFGATGPSNYIIHMSGTYLVN